MSLIVDGPIRQSLSLDFQPVQGKCDILPQGSYNIWSSRIIKQQTTATQCNAKQIWLKRQMFIFNAEARKWSFNFNISVMITKNGFKT